MKKQTYICPVTNIVKVAARRGMCDVLVVSGTRTITVEEDGGWVKENNTSHSNYNVWDADWNAE